ncbi:MAG: RNA methyltransferase [Bacteroidota bacterium]
MAVARATVREVQSLAQKKFRDATGRFVVEGLRMMRDAVDSDFEFVGAFHTAAFAEEPGAEHLLQRLHAKCPFVAQVTARELERMTETVNPPGVLAVLRQKRHDASSLIERRDSPMVLVALDGVSDPGNLGSVVRTCDWFGVDGVLLGRTSVDLYNPKVVRGTMGGIFHLPVVGDVDLLPAISRARQNGFTVYVTDAAGEAHFDRVKFPARSLIVFGNEARGVSDPIRTMADARVAVRRYGAGESLNVAVACGIVLSGLHKLVDE